MGEINKDFWDTWAYIHIIGGFLWAVTIWTYIDHPFNVKLWFFVISIIIFEAIESIFLYYYFPPEQENDINRFGDIIADFMGLGIFIFLACILPLLPLNHHFPPI